MYIGIPHTCTLPEPRPPVAAPGPELPDLVWDQDWTGSRTGLMAGLGPAAPQEASAHVRCMYKVCVNA